MLVVTDASLKYPSPAYLDDELRVTLKIAQVRGAVINFEHLIMRGNDCLVMGEIKLATINKDKFKPCRIPGELAAILSNQIC